MWWKLQIWLSRGLSMVARSSSVSASSSRPCHSVLKPLREIGLRETRIELQRDIENGQRFVILLGQAQRAPERALAKAIELVERTECRVWRSAVSSRAGAILWLVAERALHIDIAERAVAARKIRIGVDGALEIGFGRVEPRRREPP